MGFLSIIRRWALRDKMPIREDLATDGTVAEYDPEVSAGGNS